MKKADAEKMMSTIVEEVEKRYQVKAAVKMNEWEKGAYHRLYINLVVVADVNEEEKVEEADMGYINLKTNRYSTKGYDLRRFDVEEFMPAKFFSEYAEAYKEAAHDKARYTSKDGYSLVIGLSDKEKKEGISRKEMLDKSFEIGISPSAFGTYWSVVGDDHKAEEETKAEEHKEVGSYEGHSVTVKLAKNGQYIVEDDGKYTGDYGRDRDDGLYKAAMYLYDCLVEGKTIKVEDDEAYAYITECAEGMRVKIVTSEDGTIKKED